MISLNPVPEVHFECPYCSEPLIATGWRIPGMRNLADLVCPQCERTFFGDLPAGHGLFYPAVLDAETGEVPAPYGGTWFADWFCDAYANRTSKPIPFHVEVLRSAENIVLLNCLDGIYGHSLLKLLNAQYYIDNFPDLGCCVLIPHQLRHLVPEGVVEVWEVNLPFSELRGWYIALEQKIKAELDKKRSWFLSLAHPHPHPSRFSIDRFARRGDNDFSHLGKPVVVFAYRSDRRWGADLQQQHNNIVTLFEILSAHYPSLTFALIGFKDGVMFTPAIKDARQKRTDPNIEQYWVDLLYATECAVGVHGSNMLLPSALSRCAVELLPISRSGNILQDWLPNPTITDLRENMFRFRLLHGNETLENITPDMVARVIENLIDGFPRFRDTMALSWQSLPNKEGIVDPWPLVKRFSRYQYRDVRHNTSHSHQEQASAKQATIQGIKRVGKETANRFKSIIFQ